ncbi:MAG: Rieske (2Fe-2S) protein [Chloroflexi bacterium]|nr:Rieske (2Fe-2S) protein [Chloroflexota bacterium]MDA1146500.1 Rieske (2Fe-2S) protein [Chloroflexota bacterium]
MATNTTNSAWTEVGPLDDLRDGRLVKRLGDRQVVVIESQGRLYALDNRCPHEGYPLAVGRVNDEACTLTCEWHNWKFALEDGAAQFGEEGARSYPLRVDGGRIFVDLTPPPVEDQMSERLASLREGLVKFEGGRIAREAARLLELGMLPAEVMRQGALHNAEREEYGWGHALAVIADCVSLAEFYPDEAVVPTVRALFASSDPVRRYPARPTPEGQQPSDAAGEREFRHRIETEDVDGAEAMLTGAIESGAPSGEIARWLTNAATDHFLGFGHQMIYVHKLSQFADRVGWEALLPVIPSLVPSIAWATRYDKLPEMRRYITQLNEAESSFPSLLAKQSNSALGARWDSARFRQQILFGKNSDAFEAVHAALGAGVALDDVARELVLAASERMLRFDTAWETSHDEAVWDDGGWLEVTHLLTHANATRSLLARGATPEVLRSLYHSAWFINDQKRFDRPDGARADEGLLPSVDVAPEDVSASLRESIFDRDEARALAHVRQWRRTELDRAPLYTALGREAIEADDGRFIQQAHVLKTCHAAIEESRLLGGHPEADLPLMAATRFAATPRKQLAVYD